MKIILASNSPRRRELLSGLGFEYEVRTLQGLDESYPEGLSMEEIPQYISRKKAAAYTLGEDELLITADTIVWLDGEVFGKPADEAEAKQMLRKLSGKTHQVVTGVTLKTPSNFCPPSHSLPNCSATNGQLPIRGRTWSGEAAAMSSPPHGQLPVGSGAIGERMRRRAKVSGGLHSFSSVSQVTFAELSDAEIDHYVTNYRPLDKAGAYGIQEWIGFIGVTSIQGSYFNVMGLPVQRLYTEMKKLGLIEILNT